MIVSPCLQLSREFPINRVARGLSNAEVRSLAAQGSAN